MTFRVGGRRAAATVILGAWVTSLGWLMVRELGESEEEALAERPRRIGPSAEFYAVELGGVQLGTAGLTVDTSTAGFHVLEVLTLELPGRGGSTRHVARTESRLTRSFRLERADVNLSEARVAYRLEARMVGDSMLLFTGGPPSERPRPLQQHHVSAVTITAAVPLRLVATGALRQGAAVEPLTVDLLSETVLPGPARVLGDSTFVVADSAERDEATGAWRVAHADTLQARRVELLVGGQSVVAWVDEEGRPVRWEFAYGVVVERGAFELFVSDYQRRRREGLSPPPSFAAGAIPISPHAAALALDADSVVVVLARADGPSRVESAQAFAGGRQRVAGDTVVITRAGAPPTPGDSVRLRNTGRVRAAAQSPLAEGLDQAVKRYAAVGDTLTALVHWVARDVLLDTSGVAPTTPGQVLLERRSNAEGKARLLAALVETAGMPARIVSGVLVTDPTLPGHTWVEVWRDGWQAVDPVFGHVPASAALLRAIEGPGRALALVSRIGALRATVVSPTPGAQRR